MNAKDNAAISFSDATHRSQLPVLTTKYIENIEQPKGKLSPKLSFDAMEVINNTEYSLFPSCVSAVMEYVDDVVEKCLPYLK